MKKIFIMSIILSMFLSNIVYADYEIQYRELPLGTALPEGVIEKPTSLNGVFEFVYRHNGDGVMEVCGQQYIRNRGGVAPTARSLPIKIAEHESNQNLIWTGQYYYFRNSSMDGYGYSRDQFAAIYLLDENGSEAKCCAFDQPVSKIGCLDGSYYIQLGAKNNGGDSVISGYVMKSTDFQNWEKTDEEVPEHLGSAIVAGKKVAVSKSSEFYDVSYENDKKTSLYYGIGEWIINIDDESNLYISNDNIYFLKLIYPQGQEKLYRPYDEDAISCAYVDDNNIVIRIISYDGVGESKSAEKIMELSVPKQDIINELNNMKTAPYVVLNDNILGFETPPVIEDGSSLVPMRFLFEQMSADVEWNGETQTATATLDNAVVTFAIDNTNAEVNNAPATMDVPARLINGKTMIPLRFLSEEMGFDVTWDAESRTAIIE